MHRTLGWKDPPPESLKSLEKIPRAVIVFPHTSRWDTFTVYSYAFDYPELRGKFWIAMFDLPINRKFSIFFQGIFNVLWVPRDSKKGGFVQQVVNRLKDQKEFLLLISPEGACERKEWKSGYYHIARQLEVPIGVFGFDFAQHRIRTPAVVIPDWKSLTFQVETPERTASERTASERSASERSNHERSTSEGSFTMDSKTFQEQIQQTLQQAMGKIMPLNPELSWVPITALGTPTAVPMSTKLTIVFLAAVVLLGIWLWKSR